jgi:acetoacetyl-CoA synthetase
MEITEGSLLWEPSSSVKEQANLTHYMAWLEEKYGLTFKTYHDLWQWSVTEVEQFWETIWDYFEVKASQKYSTVLAERKMPGARWFVGAELNYAENLFRNMTNDRPALLYKAEHEPLTEMSWAELYDKTRIMTQALKQMGVKRGDRVVAYMPHIPETIVALLACASLGAVWSSCSPDFGGRSVLDRFSQIEPKVLVASLIVSARLSRRCWWPSTAIFGMANHLTGGR